MKQVTKVLNETIFFPLRRAYLTERLEPFLRNSHKILDLGASCGRLAKQISKKNKKLIFEGVDTHIQPKSHIKVTKYDGEKIPFKDGSFDTVTIVDVLHHTSNIQNVLKEAKRVSSKYILIKDHFYSNELEYNLLKHVDHFGNDAYGIVLEYNFLTTVEWEKLFKELDLKIVKSEKFRYNLLDPCNHVTYLLEI